jgi:hypothetical protein
MYQFMHIELFAEQVSNKARSRRNETTKNGKRKNSTKSLLSVRQVIAEAKRETGNYPHVIHPQAPQHIFGFSLDDVEMLAYQSKVNKTDSQGRKIRSDTPILLAGIASYPRSQYEENVNDFDDWLTNNIYWLQNEFGENLKNITLHLDEAHPHIHFYATSPTGRVKDIHPGHIAESTVSREASNINKEKQLAYKNAMRDFQDRYYQDVGSLHALQRLGPGVQRLTRAEKKARDAEAKQIANSHRDIKRTDDYMREELEADHAYQRQQWDAEKDEIIQAAKLEAQSMIEKAKHDINSMMDAVSAWSRNQLKNIMELMKLRKKVEELSKDLSETQLERDILKEKVNLYLQAPKSEKTNV